MQLDHLRKRMPSRYVLAVEDLKTHFFTEQGVIRAVDGLDLVVSPSETLGVVGESGCGKSVTALSILRLIPSPPGRIVGGRILFDERNLLELSEKEIRKIRGKEISMIFQDPMTCLNPTFTIGEQVSEIIRIHESLSRQDSIVKVIDLLRKVRLPSAESRIKDYPHQMSGGMRQRVMIAIALACNPKLMIADEPTTALDVTIQAQILDLIQELKEQIKMAIILISHNLGLLAEYAERVAVMYLGKIVESAAVNLLFDNPLHPYTCGLINSIPSIQTTRERLNVIPGLVPDLMNVPSGCRFFERCSFASKECSVREPNLIEVEKGHLVRCWKYCEYKESMSQVKS